MFGRKLAAIQKQMDGQKVVIEELKNLLKEIHDANFEAQASLFTAVAQLQILRVLCSDMMGEVAALSGDETLIDDILHRAKKASVEHARDFGDAKEKYLDIILHLEWDAKDQLRGRQNRR